MNIRELDEESRRTGVWPPRRIILRVDRADSEVEEEAEARAPVSVGLVDLASAPRPTVRTAPRTARVIPPEAMAAGQVAPRPLLSRPPAPGSVMRRNGRIVTPPRPESRIADEEAAFEKWLAMPLAISESDPDYQEAPAWLPEDRRLRAERRHRRISRRARTQLLSTSAVTTVAAAACCVALAVGLSQTETVGGSLGVPHIGLFGSRPAPLPEQPAEPVRSASTPKPAVKTPARKAAKAKKRSTRRRSSSASANSNQVASTTTQGTSSTGTRSSTPTPQRTVAPPAPPPPPAASRAPVAKPKSTTPTKTSSPKPVQAPPATGAPSGTPSLGGDGEPSL